MDIYKKNNNNYQYKKIYKRFTIIKKNSNEKPCVAWYDLKQMNAIDKNILKKTRLSEMKRNNET